MSQDNSTANSSAATGGYTKQGLKHWWVIQKGFSAKGSLTTVTVYAGPFPNKRDAQNKCPSDYPGFEYEVIQGSASEYTASILSG
jgi:hypothetical protein